MIIAKISIVIPSYCLANCGNQTCDVNANCTDDGGNSSNCICNSGYTGDGTNCDGKYCNHNYFKVSSFSLRHAPTKKVGYPR